MDASLIRSYVRRRMHVKGRIHVRSRIHVTRRIHVRSRKRGCFAGEVLGSAFFS